MGSSMRYLGMHLVVLIAAATRADPRCRRVQAIASCRRVQEIASCRRIQVIAFCMYAQEIASVASLRRSFCPFWIRAQPLPLRLGWAMIIGSPLGCPSDRAAPQISIACCSCFFSLSPYRILYTPLNSPYVCDDISTRVAREIALDPQCSEDGRSCNPCLRRLS